jgi:pimeloyl-ACP methyl ester carboxylesterase
MNGDTVTHGTAAVNGTRLHYVIAGDGEPLVLLHGWPQTSHEWRKVLLKLAEEYTVIAPDLPGMGDSDRPQSGYDKRTVASHIRALVYDLGFDDVSIVGHDWGMPVSYAYAAQYRSEVRALAVLDAMLPGIRNDELRSRWHVKFHQIRDLPERLVAGNERLYLSWFYREAAYDPSAIDREAVDEYVRCYSAPGGLRGGFEYYRAYDTDAEHNREHAKEKLEMPVLALGGVAGMGEKPIDDMKAVATDVRGDVVERAGHWIPEERPDYFVQRLTTFLDTVN